MSLAGESSGSSGLEGPRGAPPPSGGALKVAALAAIGYVALKFKGLIFALKALPFAKLGLTAVSSLAMVLVEAQRSGALFAVGFVALIFLHEMGHAAAIRRAGLQAGWPVFIPFFGAMISLKGQLPNRESEAEIAFAGPLAGGAASLVLAALALVTSSRLLLALAHSGFFLNLFNLIPVSPLDGGRVARAFTPRSWIVGGLLLGAMFLLTWSPQLLVIGALAVSQARHAPADDAPANPEAQAVWARRYFGLCFALGAAVYFSRRLLSG